MNRVTEASSGGSSDGKSIEESRGYEYRASVVVQEVGRDGRPSRERHADVQLAVAGPEGHGALLEKGITLEVRRSQDGEVRIYMDGYRADRKTEKIVTEILASQFERTLQPALLDPARPVAVGETWDLDPSLARQFLEERGIRVVRFAGPPAATLLREDGALVIRYRIPIAWFEIFEMPANNQAAQSEARFEGMVRLASDPRRPPIASSSHLALSLNGVRTTRAGMTQAVAWSLRRSSLEGQRLVMPGEASSGAACFGAQEQPVR
jgi:hypothetical protein